MTKLDWKEPKAREHNEMRDEIRKKNQREHSHAKQPADKFFNSQILSNMI